MSGPAPFVHILWPTDLSAASANALALAVEIARGRQAQIVALHVTERSPAGVAVPGCATPVVVAPPDPRVELTRLLARAQVRGVSAEGAVLQGEVVGRILERARAWPADLLVMATHDGRRGMDWALGSVTERVLRQATCPVLVSASRQDAEGAEPPRRILCPSDFSEVAGVALEHAVRLARAFGGRITLLHVLEWFPGQGDVAHLYVPEYQMDVSQEARDRLEQRIDAADRPLVDVVVALGRPHREILRVAREREADLIVLGLHRGRALDRTLGGTTVCHVVRVTRCPVLAVPVEARSAVARGPRVSATPLELVAQ